MYGTHVRFNYSLVNGSQLRGLQGQRLVNTCRAGHAQERQGLELFKLTRRLETPDMQQCNHATMAEKRDCNYLGMGGIARNVLTAPLAHCLNGDGGG